MNNFLFSLVFLSCNDDCWVICMLLSNVKSLFDHVTRQNLNVNVKTDTSYHEHIFKPSEHCSSHAF